MPKLSRFEDALYDLISDIKFDPHRSTFQKKLSSDMKKN